MHAATWSAWSSRNTARYLLSLSPRQIVAARPACSSNSAASASAVLLLRTVVAARGSNSSAARLAGSSLIRLFFSSKTATAAMASTPTAPEESGGGGSYTYKWPRPAVTVDMAIVAQTDTASSHGGSGGGGGGGEPLGRAELLLIQRKHAPCKGQWALPGGFIEENEGLEAAALRELAEETSLEPGSVPVLQVGAFGEPGRDPRGHTITVCYAALVPAARRADVRAADDAADAKFFPVAELPPLAFDHKLVVRQALRRLAQGAPEAEADDALRSELLLAADLLSGPWTPPTE